MSSSIVLYDVDRRGHRACWSPNAWKIRFVLNFKQIDYETRWLDFPDIAPTLKSLDFSANAAGTPYTCPAVQIGTSGSEKTAIMDSLPIARVLEKMSPEPSLRLDAPEVAEVEALMGSLKPLVGPIVLPLMRGTVFTSAGEQYKEKELTEYFGMGIDQLGKEKGGEAAWARLQGPLKDMAALLKRHGGPFVLGQEVSYADFIIVGFLQTGKRIGDGEVYRRVAAVDGAFEALFEATKKWAERDDR